MSWPDAVDEQKTQEFLKDLAAVFQKHSVELYVSDNYDGEENYMGQIVEICSRKIDSTTQRMPIYIDDMQALAEHLKNETRG